MLILLSRFNTYNPLSLHHGHLGLNGLLQPIRLLAGDLVSALTTSFQGFFVAVLLCVSNSEVLNLLKKRWNQFFASRNLNISFSPLVPMNYNSSSRSDQATEVWSIMINVDIMKLYVCSQVILSFILLSLFVFAYLSLLEVYLSKYIIPLLSSRSFSLWTSFYPPRKVTLGYSSN